MPDPAGQNRIFISCATADFESARARLRDYLIRADCEVKIQDDFRQDPLLTLAKLDGYIRGCAAVIHVLGPSPGAVPDPQDLGQFLARDPDFLARFPAEVRDTFGDGNAGLATLTYTQWEAWMALRHGVPLYVYTLPAADKDGRHFRRLVKAQRFPELINDVMDLLGKLIGDIRRIIPNLPSFVVNNLPYPSLGDLFKGRDALLQQIAESLAKPNGRPTAITAAHAIHGLGGVGKTRAIIEYAHRYGDRYSAVLFAVADSPENLSRNLAGLCGVLRLSVPYDAPEPDRLANALDWLARNDGWLLILDNVDTEQAATAVEQMLPRLRRGHVILSARVANWGFGVTPLEIDVLAPEDATELLLAESHRRRRQSDDAAQARALAVDLLGRLPLPLTQAAAFINVNQLTFAMYRERWEAQEPKTREWFDQRVMKYHHSIAVTWDTSFAELDDGARALLNMTGWLAPDAIPEFLLEHCPTDLVPDAEDALANLCHYSLATRQQGEPAFKIHRLVQEAIRTRTAAEKRQEWIEKTLHWISKAAPTDSGDVRNWHRWNPLRPHAEAIATHADETGIADPTTRLMGCLDGYFHAKGLFKLCEYWSRRALAIDEKARGKDHPNVAVHLNNLAQLFMAINRLAEAEPLMRRALAIDEVSNGVSHPMVAIRLNNLSQLLKATGRIEDAEPLMRRALTINEAAYGKSDPNVARSLSNLAVLLQDSNRIADAEPLIRRALAIDEAFYGKAHPEVARDLNNIALLLQETGRLAEAEPLIREVVHIFELSLGTNHPNVAVALSNLAVLLHATKRFADAEPLMSRALAIDEECYGMDHPQVAIDLNNLARLLQETDRVAEAEPLMRRHLEIFIHFSRTNGHEHPHLKAAINNYGQLLLQTGRTREEAEEIIQELLK